MLEFWFRDFRLGKLVEEHGNVQSFVDSLKDELQSLANSFARETGWKVYTEYKSLKATHRKGKDGRVRQKTLLEELESTDESSEGEPELERAPIPVPGTSDNPVKEGMACIGKDGYHRGLDGPTTRLLEQHVDEFLNERLHPTKRVKDPLAWWAVHEAQWPMVAAVARHSLCVPAAAACSERSFSITGHLVRTRRARLSDEKIEELSHLSCNLDCDFD